MKRILTLLLVVALAAGAWYGYTRWRDSRAQPQQAYTVGRVGRMTIESTVTAIGSLLPERQQALSLASAGTVAEVLVALDDSVAAGQVLLRLDPRDVEQSIAQARAALAVSEATLTRSRKPASAEDIASAEAALDSARANLADLEKGASSRDKQLARLSVDQAKN
ncbi:MAG: biotin/lipoyl-binding protein, partial [Chloroflexi bacterium]|nr:biotin/lipoyl-binding protein [Chloroflexota bacterium]